MPIYEYACASCDHHLEALQKISEDPLVFCPECGEESLQKNGVCRRFCAQRFRMV